MGDTFTFQIKGEAARFAPISEDNIEMLHTLYSMGAPGLKIYKAMMTVLRECSSEEQWERLTDRVVEKQIGSKEIAEAIKKLMSKTVAAHKGDGAPAADDE